MDHIIRKSHNVSILVYHFVCPAKYRRAVIDEKVDQVMKEVCLEIAVRYQIEFLEIGTDKDHVHFLVQSVPSSSPTKIIIMLLRYAIALFPAVIGFMIYYFATNLFEYVLWLFSDEKDKLSTCSTCGSKEFRVTPYTYSIEHPGGIDFRREGLSALERPYTQHFRELEIVCNKCGKIEEGKPSSPPYHEGATAVRSIPVRGEPDVDYFEPGACIVLIAGILLSAFLLCFVIL